MNPIDNFFLKLEEPSRSCLIVLRDFILSQDPNINMRWAFGMPFFYYKKKMFCYFWFYKKTQLPYLSLAKGSQMKHPELKSGGRKRFKVYDLYPDQDLDLDTIGEILQEAISLY